MGEWYGRSEDAKRWHTIQSLAIAQLKRALRVHTLPLHKITFPKANGYNKASKVWQVVNPSTGNVLLAGKVELVKGELNMRVIVEELLSGHLGIGKANARQLYDSNEAIARAARRNPPGRPPGSKNAATTDHLNQPVKAIANRIGEARQDKAYKKSLVEHLPENRWRNTTNKED
jgi:hypothetical protein